ncbi:MAG: hypothetical protein QOH16_3285 [Gaiellaceae bacterium]|jgi:uncharacterized protein involved in exopolysaccharide biosynthesis|nr:hypothetical protein [Gaiellaceae bacterium]
MSTDLDAEREIDLARWRRALTALWWLPVAGLVVGAVLGVVYSLGGTTSFKATSLISLGQPVSPGGVVIASFATNPRAISEITSSASAQEEAANAAGLQPGVLRGHVAVGTVGTTTGTGAARTTPLIALTVDGKNGQKIAAATNALAKIVIARTTAPYVGAKIKTYESVLQTTNTQLESLSVRLTALDTALATSHLDALNKLALISQVDNAEQRQGNLLDQKATTTQQLTFAKEVESAKIITTAAPVKASAHSKGTSLVVGALIGLILGGIAAIAGYGRVGRLTPA